MYDRELVLEILSQIRQSTQTILKRCESVTSVEDFTSSEWGMEKLDAVCMKLIAVGESIKNLDKVTGRNLLPKYPHVEWKKAMGLRDIITHHYFDVNAEAVYTVCKRHIPVLSEIIKRIQKDLCNNG